MFLFLTVKLVHNSVPYDFGKVACLRKICNLGALNKLSFPSSCASQEGSVLRLTFWAGCSQACFLSSQIPAFADDEHVWKESVDILDFLHGDMVASR